MNEFIAANGYVNLDFLGNLGHSIVTHKDDRFYIKQGNTAAIGSVKYFKPAREPRFRYSRISA